MQRRGFIKQGSAALLALSLPKYILPINTMTNKYDVIIIGGSYSGLSAALALGRALRNVMIIDDGKPANQQTPFSHNFLTQDGKTPSEITAIAKSQIQKYKNVSFLNSTVNAAKINGDGFEIGTSSGENLHARKLVFATGLFDIMPDIEGFKDCWGISVLHCPYCHGYEVRNIRTGILGNGDSAFELSKLISHWTKDLSLFTNGPSKLSAEQVRMLSKRNISIIEDEITKVEHEKGMIEEIHFSNRPPFPLKALYTKAQFRQHCSIPENLGCELTEEGYLKINSQNKTTIDGIYACGDNTSRMRTVANAVSMGTTTGMLLNKELIEEEF